MAKAFSSFFFFVTKISNGVEPPNVLERIESRTLGRGIEVWTGLTQDADVQNFLCTQSGARLNTTTYRGNLQFFALDSRFAIK